MAYINDIPGPVNNILGMEDVIRHPKGTALSKTFLLSTKNVSTGILTEFPLTGYSGKFRIKTGVDGKELFSISSGSDELTFSSNSIDIDATIDIHKTGDLYFELEIWPDATPTACTKVWFGKFINIL